MNRMNASFMVSILAALLRIRDAESRNIPWCGWYGWPLGSAIGTHRLSPELQTLVDKGLITVEPHDEIRTTTKFDSLASQILNETDPAEMSEEEFEAWNAPVTHLGHKVNALIDTQVDPSEPFSYWEFDSENNLVRRSFEPSECPICGSFECYGGSNCD